MTPIPRLSTAKAMRIEPSETLEYPMTIYVRTEEGDSKAYSAQSGLPFKQRAILKVVDGRTSVAVFEDSLRAFGDVRGLLESLVTSGLIKPLREPVHRAKAVEGPVSTGRLDSVLKPHNERQWSATDIEFVESSQLATLTMHSWMGPATIAMPAMGQAPNLGEVRALALAVNMIEKFVREHMAKDAPQILGNLSQMNSLELLAVSLGGYERTINHLGPVADRHVHALRVILNAHF